MKIRSLIVIILSIVAFALFLNFSDKIVFHPDQYVETIGLFNLIALYFVSFGLIVPAFLSLFVFLYENKRPQIAAKCNTAIMVFSFLILVVLFTQIIVLSFNPGVITIAIVFFFVPTCILELFVLSLSLFIKTRR